MLVPFGPWEPDSAGVDAAVLSLAQNCLPLKNGYGPLKELAAQGTSELPSRCRGLAYARTASGGWAIFAGTSTGLFKRVGSTWVDYTRLAGDYNLAGDDYWSFAQFGSKLIATQVNDAVQVIDVDSGATEFSALGGSPPQARYVAVVGDFVVLASTEDDAREVVNSDIDDAENWTAGTGSLADGQILPDYGRVTGIAGGEFGYIVQEKAIRRMIFQPGSDFAFRFERVVQDIGSASGYGMVAIGSTIFFLADDGFYSYGPAGLVAIGANRVNDWFRANSDVNQFYSTVAFLDPSGPRVLWAFYSGDSAPIVFDSLLIFDWKLDRWASGAASSQSNISAQFWATFGVTPSTSLEDLDAYGDIDSGDIPYPFDSRVWEGGRPVIAAVDIDGKLAFLESTSICAARWDTAPMHLLPGQRSMVTDVYQLGQWGEVDRSVTVLRADHDGDELVGSGGSVVPSDTGWCRARGSGRVHQIQCATGKQSSGTFWTFAQGLDVRAKPMGVR